MLPRGEAAAILFRTVERARDAVRPCVATVMNHSNFYGPQFLLFYAVLLS